MPEVTSYRHGVPCWIDLGAPDLDAVAAFYGGLLGWELGPDLGEESGGYRMFTLHGLDVAGVGPQQDPDDPPKWVPYLATDDLDASAKAVTESGGMLFVEPMDVFDSGRLAIAADPTGAVFGLWQARQHIGSRLVNEAGAPVWHELTTTDAEASLAFLRAIVGLESEPAGMDTPYFLLTVAGRTVGGVMPMVGEEWEGLSSHWMTYVLVDDVDASVEQVPGFGGTVSIPPFDIPVGRVAVLNDPAGAVFSIMKGNQIDDPNAWPGG
jgi:uncharacterized protein